MRKALILGMILLAVLVLAFDFGSMKICDGCYDLSVTVKSTSSAPLAAVSCEAFGRLEQAESGLEYLPPPETKHWSASSKPFTGAPLIVSIPLSFRESGLGRTWGDSQFRGLLVIVQYRDGKRMGQAIEIPHRRDSRSVTVEFP